MSLKSLRTLRSLRSLRTLKSLKSLRSLGIKKKKGALAAPYAGHRKPETGNCPAPQPRPARYTGRTQLGSTTFIPVQTLLKEVPMFAYGTKSCLPFIMLCPSAMPSCDNSLKVALFLHFSFVHRQPMLPRYNEPPLRNHRQI